MKKKKKNKIKSIEKKRKLKKNINKYYRTIWIFKKI